MIETLVRSNIADVIKAYQTDYPQKMARVVNYALTDTAREMWRENRVEMRRAFNNPRPYTLRGFGIMYPNNEGRAGIQSNLFGVPAYNWLYPNVEGGGRADKSTEKQLKTKGILPAGSQTMMGSNYPRDQYGNITGGRYGQMLADLEAYTPIDRSQGVAKANRKRKEKREASKNHFFVYTPAGASYPVGIAERKGKNIVIMLRFIKPANYRQTFKFYEVAQATAEMQFPVQFNRAFNKLFGG